MFLHCYKQLSPLAEALLERLDGTLCRLYSRKEASREGDPKEGSCSACRRCEALNTGKEGTDSQSQD